MPGVKGAERKDHDECKARLGGQSRRRSRHWYAELHRERPAVEHLAVVAHDFAELVVDVYRVLRGLIDELDPAALALGRAGLRNQVSGLNDGLEGVAEIVREGAEFAGNVGGDLFGGSLLAGDLIIG